MDNISDNQGNDLMPSSGKLGKGARAIMNTVGGAIPVAGGLLSAFSAYCSEKDQDKVNRFFKHWFHMMHDEIKEKQQTVIDIMSRLDLQNEKTAKRIESPEYQSLIKKTFREWSGAENNEKRKYIRNILSNAATTELSSDDVIKLYIDWINKYSDLHFVVIGEIFKNNNGITRGAIWDNIHKQKVREDSADADLYRLLFRDLTTGSIIRQFRQTDYQGNLIKKQQPRKNSNSNSNTNTMKSAFDNTELYVLTELGKQFVHYAMTDLPLKITYNKPEEEI